MFLFDLQVIGLIVWMMMDLCDVVVDYMMLLGLYYLMVCGYYYGFGFWVDGGLCVDWMLVYYYCVDSQGIGFDCSVSGSNVVGQYVLQVVEIYGDFVCVFELLLLWFYYVLWDCCMCLGRMFWDELVGCYLWGVCQVCLMQDIWVVLCDWIDLQWYWYVVVFLQIQYDEV